MGKVFYTERDIEDLAKQGVKSIAVTDDVVVTDVGREKAHRLGVALLTERDIQQQSMPARQPAAPSQAPANASAGAAPHGSPEGSGDLEARVYSAVKGKLGGQVDDALLRTIVKRVLKSLGRS